MTRLRYLVFSFALVAVLFFSWDAWANLTVIAQDVTTNTTSSATASVSVPKSFYGQVVGTGAVTQTQEIYGDIDADAANGILLCTLTLSGTTRAQDACPVVTATFTFYYIKTTNTTGTNATGAVYVIY